MGARLQVGKHPWVGHGGLAQQGKRLFRIVVVADGDRNLQTHVAVAEARGFKGRVRSYIYKLRLTALQT